MLRKNIAAMLAGAAGILAALPAQAQYYGALAYDESTRVWGQAYDQPTPRDADRTAMRYCNTGGCRIIVRTGPDQCSAIAAANGTSHFHWSTRGSRGDAESSAMDGCQHQSGRSCSVIAWQCNR